MWKKGIDDEDVQGLPVTALPPPLSPCRTSQEEEEDMAVLGVIASQSSRAEGQTGD